MLSAATHLPNGPVTSLDLPGTVPTWSASYGFLYQMKTLAAGSVLGRSYGFDPTGNVTGITDTVGTYLYDADFNGDGIDSNCDGNPDCFIATVAFGSPLAGEVAAFRDRYLRTNAAGRSINQWERIAKLRVP